MPYTKKQQRFFRAVEHGWKPTKGKYRGKKVLSARKAKALMDEAGYSRGGPLRYAVGGTVRPGAVLSGRPLPRPGRGNNRGVTLGRTAGIGALGSSIAAGSGLAAKRTRPGGPLSGVGARPVAVPPSNVRPRPGRGVNPRLALAGTPFHEASDRLDQLRKGTRSIGSGPKPMGKIV